MTPDLVARLRAGGCKPSHGCHPDICVCELADEAADEIERLRVSELAWKLMAKQEDRWNNLPQTEKEAALHQALDDETKAGIAKDDVIERLRAEVAEWKRATGANTSEDFILQQKADGDDFVYGERFGD